MNAVKSYKQPITTYEQACSIPGVGKKLGEKVWEIVEKGSFSKLDNVVNSEKMQVLNLFMNIHGVGAKTAETWFAMGHKTLDDIRQKVNCSEPTLVAGETGFFVQLFLADRYISS